jgi:3-oxoacyl-[acyl-carrier-protein] synthase II
MRRVVVTGVGSLNGAFAGGTPALAAWLAAPRAAVRRRPEFAAPVAGVEASVLADLVDETERRRLSRISQLTVAAARLALEDAGLATADDIGLVVGTEFGDLHSTMEFADGYLTAGPPGLSALVFPNTVMNAMAAATSIAVAARGAALTLNEATVAGELAVAHAASAVAAGRLSAALAGGVDQLDPFLARTLGELGGAPEVRGEGATFVVLEPREAALERGATVHAEIEAGAWRALAAPPHGVGREVEARAVGAALRGAGARPEAVSAVYVSASGDEARDRWEAALLERALPHDPPRLSLRPWVGQHAGAGPLSVAAAGLAGRGQRGVRAGACLVHGVARGGLEVALVVRAAQEPDA